jgi:uncharacterized protein (DUF1330 family)
LFNLGDNMTKAYLVGNITVTNPEGYAQYQKHVPKTISDFGGCYLVRGGDTTQMEGESQGGRNVVLEFPSRAQAEAWYTSEAYQAIIHYRKNNSTGNLILVDGYGPG